MYSYNVFLHIQSLQQTVKQSQIVNTGGGGFGIAHILAVLTLVALLGGVIMEKGKLFGSFSKYFQALGYTSTLLFHLIPAITDFLLRLPVGDPFADSLEDPLLVNFQLSFLLIYLVGIVTQLLWLKKQTNSIG